jgi:hypothetical protein
MSLSPSGFAHAPFFLLSEESSSGNIQSPNSYHHTEENHHFHISLPEKQLNNYLLTFGDEELFHDTFYFVGKLNNSRQIWFRKRCNFSQQQDLPWLLGIQHKQRAD